MRRLVSTALLVGSLVSCASLPTAPVASADARVVEGRISIRYKDAGSGKEDALSGRYVWTQDRTTTDLDLFDPLGQSVAHVTATPASASIRFRDGRVVEGPTPEAVTQQTLGYSLPVRGMSAWLDGRASADTPVTRLDDGRIRQDGWTIRFVPSDDAAGDARPRRVDLAYPGPPAEIEIRLVVDRRSAN